MRVVVGRIGRAQGIRGEATVEVRTDAPEERFSTGAVLYPSGRVGLPEQITVAGHRWQNGRLIVAVEGFADRTSIETLRGAILEADVDVSRVSHDEFHDLALVGLAVRGRDEVHLGQISEVLHLPAQDVLVVARVDDGPDMLVPFISGMVPTVDVVGGFVVVDLPDGLADLT